jgi:steroid 5-alpha reductase family enzyme
MSYLYALLALSFAVSAVGWIYFIYFFSIGYGFAISALSVATAVLFHDVMTLPAAILLGVLFVYGIRLALYLLIRERKSASYKKILYQPDNTKRKPILAMFMIWISCALLYVGQISPVTFYLYNLELGALVNHTWAWVGAVVAAAGVIIEMVADAQKSAAKKVNANRFVSHGLYRIVRCPNYFGEVLMWTGSFVICFGACCTVGQWVIASLGYIGIVYVMFSGARRLELRQNETYGNDPEFQAYIKRTPLILPLVPIYSVAKHTWLKG